MRKEESNRHRPPRHSPSQKQISISPAEAVASPYQGPVLASCDMVEDCRRPHLAAAAAADVASSQEVGREVVYTF